MIIVYLIGNGFDVNLGMKTSYADFYDWYVEESVSNSDNIERLKKNIDAYKESNLWADLEEGIGKYVANVETIEELREIYFDLNDKLKEYLQKQELNNKYINEDCAARLRKDLLNPHQYFKPRFQQQIEDFMNSGVARNDGVHIISFNYTDTIERILFNDKNKLPIELGIKNSIGSKRILHSINHIHGTLEDTELILGVNDISQVLNEKFSTDASALAMLVKPVTTVSRGDLIDDKCETLLRQADMFCLFGLSLGATDNKWWRILTEQFSGSNAHIIYFGHTDKKLIHSHDIWDLENYYRNMLLEKFSVKGSNLNELSKRIHVIVNSPMFSLV